jgi:hypothetical protein
MKIKKYYFALLLFSFLFCYCSEISEVEDKQIKIDDGGQVIPIIPDSLINKANNFVISNVGERFFNIVLKLERYF